MRNCITDGRQCEDRKCVISYVADGHSFQLPEVDEVGVRPAFKVCGGDLNRVEVVTGYNTEAAANEPRCAQPSHIQGAKYQVQQLWR
jgi:hypothetical protein